MNRIIIISMMCLFPITIMAQNTSSIYTDLGLASGTKWKSENESGYYDFDVAVRLFGTSLPQRWQWEELKASCTWTWTGEGYRIAGPNGNSIYLPAAGYRNCEKTNISEISIWGYYWSSTTVEYPDMALDMYFDAHGEYMGNNYFYRCAGLSVRLVQVR